MTGLRQLLGGQRQTGVLLHLTALPGNGAVGGFGAAARSWIDLLGARGIGVWQVLPLAPTDGTGSPYSSPSSFALNPAFVDPDQPEPAWTGEQRQACRRWCAAQDDWLPDHARFLVLRQRFAGQPWWTWPEPLRRRSRGALAQLDREEAEALQREAERQWWLEQQWQALRHHARDRGVQLLGDLPFYVAHDSADVWSRPGLFSVRADGSLSEQSGVPPDYFAATGQLWSTPVYRWRRHRLSGFRWWLRRLERQLDCFDLLRLDHFRALEAYWSVPGEDRTAEHGCWRPSPGQALLAALQRRRGTPLPLVAEDLGVITPPVEALRDRFGLPGMKVLQFAFDGDPANAYLPHNYGGGSWVVYTGTHDNATALGWWSALAPDARGQMEGLLGHPVQSPPWELLRLALASTADLAVVPLQDLMSLDDRARFNTPGTANGNWSWRLPCPIDDLAGHLDGLAAMASRYGRGCRR